MASRSLSDSKLPLAELEIEQEIEKRRNSKLALQSVAAVRLSEATNDGNKRDSRTGEAIGSKMCREHPERCTVSQKWCAELKRAAVVHGAAESEQAINYRLYCGYNAIITSRRPVRKYS